MATTRIIPLHTGKGRTAGRRTQNFFLAKSSISKEPGMIVEICFVNHMRGRPMLWDIFFGGQSMQ